MPLLRYRTRDLCSLIPGECECGRTAVRMGRIMGRSDDMLIIRGINVFPSQVESVILSTEEFEPHYQLVVDRIDNLDRLTVRVELRNQFMTDLLPELARLENKLSERLKSVLSIRAKVQLLPQGTLERSQGKSRRVIDNRKL